MGGAGANRDGTVSVGSSETVSISELRTATKSPTSEQQRIIAHPLGHHAVVRAVAGAGKTQTLVGRLERLTTHAGVTPDRILVLMFNRLAREQFQERLSQRQLDIRLAKQVHTFHSFSVDLLRRTNVLEHWTIWGEKQRTEQLVCLHKAITAVVRRGECREDEIDVEEAALAISVWKGELVPAERDRAGYDGHPAMPSIFREFEQLRSAAHALTYDDFVPMALRMLEPRSGRAHPRYDHVIVDEYQDVNHGQQRLLEAVAGRHADVMVVGDEDQTIYEWRGARPTFIESDFATRFTNKPVAQYPLSRSFRFGPLLAQCAQNVIALNAAPGASQRRVIAHEASTKSRLTILCATADEMRPDREIAALTGEALKRLAAAGVQSFCKHIVVLGRCYAQLAGFESELLRLGIPYEVAGQSPFFRRREITLLLNYLRIGAKLDCVCDSEVEGTLLAIANVPNRYLRRSDVAQACRHAAKARQTVREALSDLELRTESRSGSDTLLELEILLDELADKCQLLQPMRAADVLQWLVEKLEYDKYLRTYYGRGDAYDRTRTLDIFLHWVSDSRFNAAELVEVVERLDPTRGEPRSKRLHLTTIHRTKGLEFDRVVIPACVEGFMPFAAGSGAAAFDLAAEDTRSSSSDPLEAERRLFYVAITRAKKGVLIGSITDEDHGTTSPKMSRFLHELRLTETQLTLDVLRRRAAGMEEPTHVIVRNIVQIDDNGMLAEAIPNLCEHYLPAAGLHEAARALAGSPAAKRRTNFAYPVAYPPLEPTRRTTKSPRPKEDKEDAGEEWYDFDDDIDLPF